MGRSSRLVQYRRHRLRRAEAHACAVCGAHRARYQYRGRVRADSHHTLCFRCFRAAANRLRAWAMAA
jgi:hypothetical protein